MIKESLGSLGKFRIPTFQDRRAGETARLISDVIFGFS